MKKKESLFNNDDELELTDPKRIAKTAVALPVVAACATAAALSAVHLPVVGVVIGAVSITQARRLLNWTKKKY